ncbi:DUF91 domain-containing protein [bacterium]|nr:DUF91 domain-containing protein [bacterium]
MPVNQTLWCIDDIIEEISEIDLGSENELEEIIESNIGILNPDWMIIGRQVLTDFNKRIDLLAIDSNGNLVVIELKKNRTTRDVVAQAIDYASWIKKVTNNEIENVFRSYQKNYLKKKETITLANSLYSKYNVEYQEDEINTSHQIIIVASELDSHTERIINYLSESEIPINIVFFKIFSVNGKRVLSRAWLTDPSETEQKASNQPSLSRNRAPWNGEYYVSFGIGNTRSWEDAMKFGFISGGGKPWYSRTLNQLNNNDRVWVNIPHIGYVGVGTVIETVQLAKDMLFDTTEGKKTIFDLETEGSYHFDNKEDEDNAEYIVRVEWIKTVSVNEAVKELGFFGNQNTVCKPANTKWIFTIDHLKRIWNIK